MPIDEDHLFERTILARIKKRSPVLVGDLGGDGLNFPMADIVNLCESLKEEGLIVVDSPLFGSPDASGMIEVATVDGDAVRILVLTAKGEARFKQLCALDTKGGG